ncbi:MAG: MFS transporter [Opitutaceae bacterium]|nr:MFS transporter [Opitutaceae bacterium]
MSETRATSRAKIYWTAFIGLFFDYYDLYLFVYLEKGLAAHFALTDAQSNLAQFAGLAGVGAGSLLFGWLADLFGRGRMMLTVFVVYAVGIAGLSLAWDFGSLVAFRLLASLALGAEWGISHTYLAERVDRVTRYRFSALLQFSILGGLLAALAARYLLPAWGWRWLFAASIVPVAVLSLIRWRVLAGEGAGKAPGGDLPEVVLPGQNHRGARATWAALRANAVPFGLCFGIASLTIASGTINVFFAKDLPQGTLYTMFFWFNVAPGMLFGAWIVRRFGVTRALSIYAVALTVLSLFAWASTWPDRKLAFALGLPLLNGIPLGLMGAYFNEVFGQYRTMFSGTAYNLGRILAGFSPALITALGLHQGGNYFLFTAVLGAGVLMLGRGVWAHDRCRIK